MYQTKSRAELKSLARDLLRGNYSYVILSMLMISFLSSGLNAIASLLFYPSSIFGYAVYYTVIVLSGAVSGIFSAGIACLYLSISCGKKWNIMNIFYGFLYQPSKSFLLSLVFSILNLLCSIPVLFVNFSEEPQNVEQYMQQFSIYIAAYLLCSALYGLVTLIFSQSYFLLLDYPELSVKELLVHSIRLMKGNLLRLLLLQISFLPIQLLGITSCGIGYLWITPYMQMTYALFYLDLVKKKAAS